MVEIVKVCGSKHINGGDSVNVMVYFENGSAVGVDVFLDNGNVVTSPILSNKATPEMGKRASGLAKMFFEHVAPCI